MTSNLRDSVWFCNKLNDGWLGNNFSQWISQDILAGVIERFTKLSPHARVRLLLSCCYLTPQQRDLFSTELKKLVDIARGDDEEWVRIVGGLVGDYKGWLSLEYFDEDKVISDTMSEVQTSLKQLPQDKFIPRPLEEEILSYQVVNSRGTEPEHISSHLHFGVRDTAQVLGPSSIDEDGKHSLLQTRTSSGLSEIYKRRGFSLGDSNMFRSSKLSFKKQVSPQNLQYY
eukprot:TRINITY_DN13111_c2_g1_i2.p1 TRINITY_DN13111_c2_g1~~TRINITY_DN13111_c2_g1_i2.p1  ORF type:complete len:228 (-),score=11.73 TRINITY_DN13111_c2_g1_i2:56-739(-)